MIVVLYLVSNAEGRSAFALLLAGWGRRLNRNVRMIDYGRLLSRRRLPIASYIFAGLETLDAATLERLATAYRHLREADPDILLLNHPLHMLRRYALLRNLYEQGINPINVYRLDEARAPNRYPVFLRRADDHNGPRSELLADQASLDSAVRHVKARGESLDGMIVTEYMDTRGDDGIYRKYAAFLINGEIVPRHLQFSDGWMVKGSTRQVDPILAEEEKNYILENPHQEELRRIFSVANIDYGRIDYAFHDGKLCVFEINSNPQIVKPGASKSPLRNFVKQTFAERIVEQFERIANVEHAGGLVTVDYGDKPWHKRRPPFVEAMVRASNSLGLGRYQPFVFRTLLRIRGLWSSD